MYSYDFMLFNVLSCTYTNTYIKRTSTIILYKLLIGVDYPYRIPSLDTIIHIPYPHINNPHILSIVSVYFFFGLFLHFSLQCSFMHTYNHYFFFSFFALHHMFKSSQSLILSFQSFILNHYDIYVI